MIPKIIHYCWFGGNSKPKSVEKCIDSWRLYCREFEFIEWNESNFDISSSPQYVQQAYEAKKWAFVSDYVRLCALVEYGGIYLDTDMELLKPIDQLLMHKAFSGTEDGKHISAGFMGGISDFGFYKQFKNMYNSLSFVNEDGTYNYTTIVEYITEYCKKRLSAGK